MDAHARSSPVAARSSKRYQFTSESVSMGHPDKVADQISDALLDAMLEQDPYSRVAIETLVSTGMAVVAGEVTTKAYVEIPDVVRGVIKEIGYTSGDMAFDYESCAVLTSIKRQSPDIAMGVDRDGAGDQGMMFGYACRETPTLMPLPIHLAHRLVEHHVGVRREEVIPGLRPDAKSQVTVAYEGDRPVRVETVVLSTQHAPMWNDRQKELAQEVTAHIVKPVLNDWYDADVRVLVNPTGRFEIGGPHGDTGLTGRKIIVDTYGGRGRHGGGAFSGKDPTKVDRSATYMCRYIAKNIVAAELAEVCEVQVSYAIGVAEPTSVCVSTEGTGKVDDDVLAKLVREHFPLTPRAIIEHLKLRRPIYKETARHGHFGRELPNFTWERTDKAAALRKAAGL
ncbi:MAG: methionine adenosyltransferase [Planctomycetota bacterium]